MVEIFEILTKDFPFVKKKYNKLCYCHNYTTICSALIFLNFLAKLLITRQFILKYLRPKPIRQYKRQGLPSPCLAKQ